MDIQRQLWNSIGAERGTQCKWEGKGVLQEALMAILARRITEYTNLWGIDLHVEWPTGDSANVSCRLAGYLAFTSQCVPMHSNTQVLNTYEG